MLSPGEALSADDSAFGLRRLNLLADELSAQSLFLFRDILTTNAQTGHITLGAGSWTAISPSDRIISVSVAKLPIDGITMTQYAAVYDKTTSGSPTLWAHDGLSTVYFWLVPNGQSIQIQTQKGVASFADLATEYTAANGYANYLGAALAVRIAPTKSAAGVTPNMLRAEKAASSGVKGYKPAIVDAYAYCNSAGGSTLNGRINGV